ncbi:MAG: hemolysin family protein [Chloroflexia bacterium]
MCTGLLVLLLFLAALFSAGEAAFETICAQSEARQALTKDQSATARRMRKLAERSSELLATVRIGSTLAGLLAAGLATRHWAPRVAETLSQPPLRLTEAAAGLWGLLLVLSLLGLAFVLLGQMIPRTLAERFPWSIARTAVWPLQGAAWLLYPFVRSFAWVHDALASRGRGGRSCTLPDVTEEEIRTLVDAGEQGGAIEAEERQMIDSILELDKTLVREVMVPRTDITALEVNTPLPQALEIILRSGHSRVPVYEGTMDHIVGLLYAKDLLRPLQQGRVDLPLRELLRPAYFVPETKYVDDLLNELRQQRTHMAIVVDEYGGTAGLVTIEDLLEEIVGEIQDEYDAEEPLVQDLGNGEFLCDARLSADDAAEAMGLELPEGDFDTLGGFVYAQLGSIPRVGDKVVVGQHAISVDSVHGLRLGKLRIRRIAPASQEPPA